MCLRAFICSLTRQGRLNGSLTHLGPTQVNWGQGQLWKGANHWALPLLAQLRDSCVGRCCSLSMTKLYIQHLLCTERSHRCFGSKPFHTASAVQARAVLSAALSRSYTHFRQNVGVSLQGYFHFSPLLHGQHLCLIHLCFLKIQCLPQSRCSVCCMPAPSSRSL